MSTSPEPFRQRDSAPSQLYLDAAIRTASPARLRLMMIQRGIEVCDTLSKEWRSGQSAGPNEYSLKLLELLNELLNGVTKGTTDGETEVCHQVADLYVFLVQHMIVAEQKSDASAIDEIRIVLETEEETWRRVCANESTVTALLPNVGDSAESAPQGLNFEA